MEGLSATSVPLSAHFVHLKLPKDSMHVFAIHRYRQENNSLTPPLLHSSAPQLPNSKRKKSQNYTASHRAGSQVSTCPLFTAATKAVAHFSKMTARRFKNGNGSKFVIARFRSTLVIAGIAFPSIRSQLSM